MIGHPPAVIAKAGFATNEHRLFCELWAELFNQNTVDTYRPRVMNAHTILRELISVIDDRKENEAAIINAHFVAEEAIEILSRDILCQSLYSQECRFVEKSLKKNQTAKDQDSWKEVSEHSRILLQRLKSDYFEALLKELERTLLSSGSEDHVCRLTGALATELIWRGFSFEYLDSRTRLLFDTEQGIDFKEKWRRLSNDLSVNKRSFHVHLMISSPADVIALKTAMGFRVKPASEGALGTYSSEFLLHGKEFICELDNIVAADSFSAAQKGYEELSYLIDQFRFQYRKHSDCSIGPIAHVIDTSSGSTFASTCKSRPIGFQMHGDVKRLQERLELLEIFCENGRGGISVESRRKLLNSFRYFSLSLSAAEDESRFLHAWIALEYLLREGEHASIIGPIIKHLPRIMALTYVRKLVVDLTANLRRMRAQGTVLAEAGIGLFHRSGNRDDYRIENVFAALQDTSRVAKMLSSTTSPLLKTRISQVASGVVNPKAIQLLMHRNFGDVKWHLQRMYRVRNKLVHSAAIEYDLRQLIGNLDEYYTTVMNTILFAVSEPEEYASIDAILRSQSAQFDFAVQTLDLGQTPKIIVP